ncbi:hypothetical protein GDO86_012052 [Hymenochirus boettgeri]|uniref:Secreted protein n=1 Tax=Hymenochirus boettgeri TaxID=247094 RepID=A0A8T2JJ43_9PIPI|nr:hypothetical protein GDO86_012052 [Hymenochirus boettgeri]
MMNILRKVSIVLTNLTLSTAKRSGMLENPQHTLSTITSSQTSYICFSLTIVKLQNCYPSPPRVTREARRRQISRLSIALEKHQQQISA